MSSNAQFHITGKKCDIEGFAGTLYDTLNDPDEKDNVEKLLAWWDQ